MVVDCFLADFKRWAFLLLILIIGCKEKNRDAQVNSKDSIDEDPCIAIINDSLENELESFVTANPLAGIEGNAYVLTILKKKKDTLITIERSFKPVLTDTSLKFVGAFYHQDNPILLIDKKTPIGNRFYDTNCLNQELYEKLEKTEHPTSLYKDFVSSSFKVMNDNLEEN